ncbi:MAG: hypothetical protein IPL07_17780 [Acidimicrobiaceae bacterium]|nr:hypothetical protein [Acidimicrobiaceae bacterium]
MLVLAMVVAVGLVVLVVVVVGTVVGTVVVDGGGRCGVAGVVAAADQQGGSGDHCG